MSSQVGCVSPDVTVADVATRHPETIPVLERLGVDYCCGGGRPLGDALAAKGLDWQEACGQIEAAIGAASGGPPSADWTDSPLTELMAHILDRYHAKLRELLPMLTLMGEKVINAHGNRHPEVRQAASVFAELRAELESHMMKEEHVLFPFIEQLESGLGQRHPMLGHIASPIGMMRREHDSAGAALAALRTITSWYVVPADGCATFRAYYDGLGTLERELHEHIHLENNVLFSRAVALEARVVKR